MKLKKVFVNGNKQVILWVVSLGLDISALADKFIIFETSKPKIDFKFGGSWRWIFTKKSSDWY